MTGPGHKKVRVGIVGDYDPNRVSHQATEKALEHAATTFGILVEAEWLPTVSLEERAAEKLLRFDAVWCAPGDYESQRGAVEAIRIAREGNTPLLGTCNGFQHVVIEYARDMLGFTDAAHAENDPNASNLFIRPLSCSLFGRTMRVEIRRGSRVHGFYGGTEAEEEYRCDFGLDPARQKLIEEGGLRVSGADQDGEARVLELPDHPFYVATLFVPQMGSSAESPHPLVVAFLKAALDTRGKRQPWQETV